MTLTVTTKSALSLAAWCAAVLGAAPLAAEAPLPAAIEFSAATIVARDTAAAPQLTEINYERLYRRLVQAGMFSQVLGYTLTVDAEGKVTGCSFTRDFRMVVTERDLCRAFTRSFSFVPARDTAGKAVAGQYQGKVEVASFFQPNL
jgi:protein TonB